MPGQPAHSTDTDDERPDDWARALTERQLQRLGQLAEMGLTMAQAIERRAKAAEAAGEVVQGAALASDRLAREVRMTVMMQSKLIQDLKAPAGRRGSDQSRRAPAPRAVRQMAKDAWGDDTDMRDYLRAEANERLDDEDDL